MNIHERFQAARDYFGKTQSQMAKEVKVERFGRGAVSAIENGKSTSPNPYYVKLLEEKGINSYWLLYGEGEMLEKKKIHIPEDYEEIKKENSYLRKEVEQLKEQMKAFLTTINHLSGKPSEHKQAAVPNEKRRNNSSSFGRSYVPATN